MISAADCQAIDQWIRAGELARARKALARLKLVQVPRSLAATVAELFRRAGLAPVSLRLLNKIVRTESELKSSASPRELAEYAMALTKIGATKEARELLIALDPADEPVSRLYYGLSFFSEWDYEKALNPLLEFKASPLAKPYELLIANVNLAAVYVQLHRVGEAEELIEAALLTARESKLNLLYANLLELSAQLRLKNANFDGATARLEEATKILKDSGLSDELFVHKWQALVELYRSPHSENSHDLIAAVRTKAGNLRHWETVRDLDSHVARVTVNSSLYRYLYHGTPHFGFRSLLRKSFTGDSSLEATYDWHVGPDQPSDGLFNVAAATLNEAKSNLKIGDLPHQLLEALCSDFYRPLRLTSLTTRLFPGEFYNPATMPNRIHQIVKRLRLWCTESRIPIFIQETEGCYALHSESAFTIRTTLREPGVEANHRVSALRNLALPSIFSSKEAAGLLQASLSKTTRLLNEAIASGQIEKLNVSSQTRYRFVA